jgi:hypothetical protein
VPACLAITAERGASADGGWPTQAEYAEYWKMSDRQAQREWKLVKRAFPGEDGPDRLAKAMHANYRARLSEKVSYAFSIPADADADAVAVGV